MPPKVRISTGLPDANPMIGDAALFDMLAERLRSRPRSFLYLVPTRMLTRAFTCRMFERGVNAFVADQAFTLNDFVCDALKKLRPNLRIIDELERILVISRLVSKMTLPALGDNADGFPGLVEAVADAIRRLKQAKVTPESSARRLTESESPGKTRALLQIYERYERELRRLSAVDEHDVFAAFASASRKEIADGPMTGRELIVFHAFYDFTPAQLEVVKQLCECAGDALFVVDHENNREKIFGPAHQIIAAFETGMEIPRPQAISIPPPIENVARHIFTTTSASRVRVPPVEHIRLIEARDRRGEVEAIAADIKRAHVRENVPLRDICVTFANAGAYDSLVREVFPRMGLQFNLARGFPLDRSPLVAVVLKLLEIVQSDYQRERVTEFFCSPYVSFHCSAETRTRPLSSVSLDRVARGAGVIRGRVDWIDQLKQRADALRKESAEIEAGIFDPERDADAARRIDSLKQELDETRFLAHGMSEVFEELSALEQKRTLKEFVTLLRRLMRRFNIAAGVAAREPSALPPIELEKAFKALAKFERVLDAVEQVDGQESAAKHDLAGFTALLQDAVAAEEYQVQTYPDAGVQVTGLLDLRGMAFRRLYVGGMLNGDFPSRQSRSIFFSEAEAESLGLHDRKRHDAEQRYEFVSLLCSGRERVTFSYPAIESGNPTVRSPFIDDLLSFLPENSITPVVAGSEEAFSIDRLYRRIGEELCESGKDGLLAGASGVAELVLADSPLGDAARRIRRGLVIQRERESRALPSPYSGMLRDARALKALALAFGGGHKFSITQLETYAACPFRFFCSHALQLEELAEPEEEVTPLSRGGVIHEMLRCFYMDRRRSGKGRPVEAELTSAREELVRLAREKFGALPFDDLFWEKDVDRVVRPEGLIDAFLGVESAGANKCEPRFFEFAFGGSSRMEEIDPDSAKPALKLDSNTLVIGKIDRIDISPDGKAVVVDYKTGGPNFPGINLMLDGRRYQLPIYLLAVRELLGLTPIAGAYYQVKDGSHCKISLRLADAEAATECEIDIRRMRGAVSEKSFLEVIDQVKRNAVRAVKEIRSGHFSVSALGESQAGCRHCEFKYVCRAANVSEDEADNGSDETDTGTA